jgi:methylmalonyl-CoA mutase N-terminal domain/subunit
MVFLFSLCSLLLYRKFIFGQGLCYYCFKYIFWRFWVMAEKKQLNRWRCTVVGCNPVLKGLEKAEAHRNSTGHRVAKWPVRSAKGQQKARQRNRSGYYDVYNVGDKSYEARFGFDEPDEFGYSEGRPLSGEDLAWDEDKDY